MPILMPKDTCDALGKGAEKCESRSLLQQKLVFFDSEVPEYKQVALDLILNQPSRIETTGTKKAESINKQPGAPLPINRKCFIKTVRSRAL